MMAFSGVALYFILMVFISWNKSIKVYDASVSCFHVGHNSFYRSTCQSTSEHVFNEIGYIVINTIESHRESKYL